MPPNTGNIIRLCYNTGAALHIVKPIGFDLGERSLRRAAVNFVEAASVKLYESFDEYAPAPGAATYLVTTNAKRSVYDAEYRSGDTFVFGNEAWGIPAEVERRFGDSERLLIPQNPSSRSLNLANAVSVVLYEALRQNGFGSLKSDRMSS